MAKRVTSLCRWWLEDDDLNPAEEDPTLRDALIDGQSQKQLALNVRGTYDEDLVIGAIAIRCERKGPDLTPLSMKLTDRVPPPEKAFMPRGYQPYLGAAQRMDNTDKEQDQ